MCRMLGMVSRVPIPEAVLAEFGGLAARGKVPSDFDCGPITAKAGHPDGWGIGAISPDGEVYHRSAESASTDGRYAAAAREVRHLPGVHFVLLAHLRRVLDKTLVAEEHTLPFRREDAGGVHYFAQVGDIEKFGLRDGGTDQRWVCDRVRARMGDRFGPKEFTAGIAAVREECRTKFPKRLSSITAILSDGQGLLAHRDPGTCSLYFTLHLGRAKDMVLVSSEVLSSVQAKWRLLKQDETVAVDASLSVS